MQDGWTWEEQNLANLLCIQPEMPRWLLIQRLGIKVSNVHPSIVRHLELLLSLLTEHELDESCLHCKRKTGPECDRKSGSNFFAKKVLRILFQNCSIFTFRRQQWWHPTLSPLYDLSDHINQIFSESLWHLLSTDPPTTHPLRVIHKLRNHTLIQRQRQWQRRKDLTCAIFLKMIWPKDIKSDDESVMHH